MVKFFLKHCTKMYRTYNKVKDIFTEPTLHFYHGSWKKYSGLPVWRRGPVITIGRSGEYMNCDDENHYGAWAKYQIWNPEFLKSKGWWGRTWRRFIRPTYQLPDWLSFYIFNHDVWVKSKWDYFSYEFPPQFCVVFFGRCIAWTLSGPHSTRDYISRETGKSYPESDHYWEAIERYLNAKSDSVEERLVGFALDEIASVRYSTPSEKEKMDALRTEQRQYTWDTPEHKKIQKKINKLTHNVSYITCRPEYLRPQYIECYNRAYEDMCKNDKFRNCFCLY